jgi:hypothetical protein
MEENRNAYTVLKGKPEGKRPLGRHGYSWEDDIKIYLKSIRWQNVDCIYLAQENNKWRAVINTIMNFRVS